MAASVSVSMVTEVTGSINVTKSTNVLNELILAMSLPLVTILLEATSVHVMADGGVMVSTVSI